ncbi:MAG: phosphoadenosine phosphosulfate reductase family protein, partial [Thaumarchaeota archaeon]|nr:phosphoadenosine phosphosulfate reductase family protein [Nitrososphaerota archaeon]
MTTQVNGISLENSVGLFSGGKDSITACHIANVKKVVTCKTGVGLNYDFIKDTCQSLGWELVTLEPKIGESFEDFVRKFGFPHVGMHNAVFGYLKWHPIRTWYKQQKDKSIVLISGRRKKESARRKKMKSNKQYDETEGMKFYSPIYEWSGMQVYKYIEENKLPLSPIYRTMHMSGDCFCGAFDQGDESMLLYT